MSSRWPANVDLSFEAFARRGGESGPHRDGWGVASFLDDTQAAVIKEIRPASQSPVARRLTRYGVRSTIVLGHVRKATQGEVAMDNTQPFKARLYGRSHVYAHNGDLVEIQRDPALGRLGARWSPAGQTDSEWAFCWLLTQLEGLWASGTPALSARLRLFEQLASLSRPLGPANFIYSDGELLFVHAHKRTQPDKSMAPPGLHMLARTCALPISAELDGVQISSDRPRQKVVLFASKPLSDEDWTPLPEGAVLVARRGELISVGGAGG